MTDKKTEKTSARYSVKSPSRGGYRPGGGRPRGSTTKVTVESLMSNIELSTGKTYAEVLAMNYAGAIQRSDWNGVRDYDKAFMNKLVADKTEVTTIESDDAVQAKQQAFAEAIAQIAGIKPAN
jgi:hypothetical protein